VQIGTENKKKVIWAAVLGGIALLVVVYELIPSSSTSASAPAVTATQISATSPTITSKRSAGRHLGVGQKKSRPQSLDPTLHLAQLAAAEQVKYEGSGRNIFISQADPAIPPVKGNPATDHKATQTYTPPPPPPPPPIPLKFFGFASGPGEPKKIFLSKGEDVFIAGEGEIVDRRYKVLHISPTSVEIQDVVGSGPPQNLPLVQG
jgi:hypothetical protein